MTTSSLARDEAIRLRALNSFRILDTEPEPLFDKITSLASILCESTSAYLCFIAEDRRWIKSQCGNLNCASLRSSDTCVPIIDRDGNKLGELGVEFTTARTLSKQQQAGLESLAEATLLLLEQRRTNLELATTKTTLVSAQDEVQRTKKANADFVRSLNHEIRTALNGIIGTSEIIFDQSQDSELRTNANTVIQIGENLLGVTDGFLDLAKLEAGKLEFDEEEFSLDQLMEVICTSLGPTAHRQEISFNLNMGEDLPDRYVGDVYRIKQVLDNLLSHTISFTEGSEINFAVNVSAENPNQLFFLITEGSPGERNSFESLLDKYAQGGFPLTKESNESRHQRVLVAEDNAVNNLLLVKQLESLGYETRAVANGEQILRALAETHYDLLITDCQMPMLDGFEAVRRLRQIESQEPKRARIPVIAITSNAMIDQEFKRRSSGMDSLLIKPLKIATLVQTIEDLGLATPRCDSVFSEFKTSNVAESYQLDASSLGLAISKKIILKMGGSFQVVADKSAGNCLFLRIPVKAAPKHDRVLSLATNFSQERILVIEANTTHREILVQYFKRWNAEPDFANDGQAALNYLRKAEDTVSPYDLILLDNKVTNTDCWSVARFIEKLPHYKRKTILMLGSPVPDAEQTKARVFGIEDILIKPFREKSLQALVAAVVSQQNTAGQATPYAAQTIPGVLNVIPDPTTKTLEKILIVEDNEANRMLLKSFLRTEPFELTFAKDGASGLEAYKAGNFDLVLMDLQLPKLDGYQALRSIRTWEKARGRSETPVLALTASSLAEARQACVEAGFTEYVTKPIRNKLLIAKIKQHLRAHSPWRSVVS